ncbi:unnamed protein product [Urochloa decumbens]|uniref:DUF1618 domain-containing protein n=1 Tax=Urochloa decumbens TaxID=240449 RepID=A0ABC9FN79_9POAL
MEAQPQSGSPSTASYPRWVMLEQYLEIIKVKVEDSSRSTTEDDARTLAAARTSNSHPIQVSLRLAEPPALSRVFLRIPNGLNEEKSKVLAAHGDSVLIQVRLQDTYEHFVYNAGDHAADPPRPPSLWLLPPYYEQRYLSGSDQLVPRELFDGRTGLLRRGEDDLAVAELRGPGLSMSKDTPKVADLYLFRSGEWNRYQIKVREGWDIPTLWDTVVPVDDRLLCFVYLCCCVMLLDVFAEMPTVQYVQLPMDPRDCNGGLNRNVCTTAGGGTLKFVNIFGRCCCGGDASCDCKHSHHAYIIHTWTMRIGNKGVVDWVQDGMVDATELWALDAYKGHLPCDPLDRPVVSIDEAEVICFRLRDTKCDSRTLWQILVNVRSKTIHSVSRHEEERGYCYTRDKLIPSKVSYFFNTCPRSGDATLTGQSQVDIERSPSVVVDVQPKGDGDASNPTLQDIFEALQEIPSYGLLGPDEVKAYRILWNNNGCRLRSLLRLPKNLRKNWLQIEIKASED